MKALYWNRRGLGKPHTKLVLKNMCLENNPDLVFISEPMIDSSKLSALFWAALDLKLFVVNARGDLLPNLWGLCRMDLNPSVIASSQQHISISLSCNNKTFFFSAVYAHTQYLLRRSLWSEILVACDEFKAFSEAGCLTHIQTRGAEFTWSNRRRGLAHTEKRLDRVLCNDSWISDWTASTVFTLPRYGSDHHPLILNSSMNSSIKSSHFRFHRMWLLHPALKEVVQNSCSSEVVGCPMFILSQNLRNLKATLRTWNKQVFGDIHTRVKNALARVDSIQNSINDLGQSEALLIQEEEAQKDLLLVLKLEEEFWREKSRINWHLKGDRNTKYFQRIAKIKHATKSLTFLREGDNILLSQHQISSHVLSYFTNLYASNNVISQSNCINSAIPNLVSQMDNNLISSIPSAEEIKSAEFWDIIANDVCNSVMQFFTQSWILPNLNSNSVVLVPKFPGADRIEDFRPIALANFQFKIITKVLADRLALIAPKIVSSQQRGFIKGRQIHDCICIASEAINLLDHKSFGGNLAIKLDIKKAFDTIDWQFLMDTLKAYGFCDTFINWIKVILNSAKLSICVNGESVGFFGCKRGVRQGDPYHLCSFVLLKMGLKRDLMALKNLFIDYAMRSGQNLSLSKCKFYSTTQSHRKIAHFTSWLGFGAAQLPFNYLGVPLFKGKPKAIHLQRFSPLYHG
ncbi:unnamed protein product [Lupinus luteus]|uniref:Reverse transcriptase domain-containing protein n=1 Tax=Lupinus luteus TaxID=3873 RepID=A0AAV1XZ07_LUPLU